MRSHCSAVSNAAKHQQFPRKTGTEYLSYLKPLQLLWMEGMQNISFKSREGSGTCRMSKSLSGESSSHNLRHLDSINIPFVISSHNELRDCGLLPVPHLSISIVNKPSDLDTIGLLETAEPLRVRRSLCISGLPGMHNETLYQ